LRDEDNRKRALQNFQPGVREVKTFFAEVQAEQQNGADTRGVGKKGDGKKLAKICMTVAMKRLAK
jgi:hypothetical protein